MTVRQGFTPNPHPVINNKGEINSAAWEKFEVEVNGKTPKEAKHLFQDAIFKLPEPPVATKSGKPSKHWIAWYKLTKQVTQKIALNTCKKIISGELKEYDTKPVPSRL